MTRIVIFALLVALALVGISCSPDDAFDNVSEAESLPQESVVPEKVLPEDDLSVYDALDDDIEVIDTFPPKAIWFRTPAEVLELFAVLEYDEETLLEYLWKTSLNMNGVETREDVENLFVLLNNIYLPTNHTWGEMTYLPEVDRNYIEIFYDFVRGGILGSGQYFLQRFQIFLNEEASRSLLENARTEALDITDKIRILVQDNVMAEYVLRPGYGISVFMHSEPHVEQGRFWYECADTSEIYSSYYDRFFREFTLDVQGTHVALLLSEEYDEDEMHRIIADIAFARGVFERTEFLPQYQIEFRSHNEVVRLRNALQYEDEQFITFLRESRFAEMRFWTRSDVENFFAKLDSFNLPIDRSWTSFSFFPRPAGVSFHFPGIGHQIQSLLINLSLSEEDWLDYLLIEDMEENDTEHTAALLSHIRNEESAEGVLRVGSDIRVFEREETSDLGCSIAFALDVKGRYVYAEIMTENRDAALDILANLEFARGVFGTQP